jgi:hypothetical protein
LGVVLVIGLDARDGGPVPMALHARTKVPSPMPTVTECGPSAVASSMELEKLDDGGVAPATRGDITNRPPRTKKCSTEEAALRIMEIPPP